MTEGITQTAKKDVEIIRIRIMENLKINYLLTLKNINGNRILQMKLVLL